MPSKEVYAKRREKGVCVVCGRYPKSPTSLKCSLCTDLNRLWTLNYYRTKPGAREQNNANTRAVAVKRSKEGKCVRCGGVMTEFDEGHVKCDACRHHLPKQSGSNHMYEELMIIITTEDYKEEKRNAATRIQSPG